MERLVSLAPSATSTIAALGGADQLVGVTAHCAVDEVPSLGGWLTPDLDRLEALNPDLVLTADALQREVRAAVEERGYPVHHREPTTLDDVLAGIRAVGTAIGRGDEGRAVASEARDRLDRLRTVTPQNPVDRPVVYCEEWPDPPMAAGNWVPEAVEIAGGRYPFVEPGDRSTPVDEAAVVDADPAHIVIHHCGFGERAEADVMDRWGLEAEVHVIDDDLLNQPGPRLVDGVEHLATLLHGIPMSTTPFAAR